MKISIEGLPGSGKTTILKILESMGYNCYYNKNKYTKDENPSFQSCKLVGASGRASSPSRFQSCKLVGALTNVPPLSESLESEEASTAFMHDLLTPTPSNTRFPSKPSKPSKPSNISKPSKYRMRLEGQKRKSSIQFVESSPYLLRKLLRNLRKRSPIRYPALTASDLDQRQVERVFSLNSKDREQDTYWKPDCIIFLDCPPDVAIKRLHEDYYLTSLQVTELYGHYDWVLHSNNCDIPVFRVNSSGSILDTLHHLLEAIQVVIREFANSNKKASSSAAGSPRRGDSDVGGEGGDGGRGEGGSVGKGGRNRGSRGRGEGNGGYGYHFPSRHKKPHRYLRRNQNRYPPQSNPWGITAPNMMDSCRKGSALTSAPSPSTLSPVEEKLSCSI